MRIWRDHSLTIICLIVGSIGTVAAWSLFDEGKAFDTLLGLSLGFITVGLFYLMAGPFREKNKPEDPPKYN